MNVIIIISKCWELQLEAGDVAGDGIVDEEVVHRNILTGHHLDDLLGHNTA